jgi:predicted molibdopterin-dependent oxidoreductase YjgC
MPAFQRIALFEPGPAFEIWVDGTAMMAYEGETLAAALLAAGRPRFSDPCGAVPARGVFCGMGACFSCLVTVDGRPNVRSCVTLAQPGQQVELNPNGAG